MGSFGFLTTVTPSISSISPAQSDFFWLHAVIPIINAIIRTRKKTRFKILSYTLPVIDKYEN